MSDLLDAAERYLSLGLSVIALTGKTPNVKVHKHGLKDALSAGPHDLVDSRQLRAVFEHPATTGIGIVIPYPYVVVDIDSEVGAQAWKLMVGEDNYLPERWVAATGRGLHLWYACVEPSGSMKLAEKLDLKGQGGYVAAPPSQHFDEGGQPDAVYRWLAEPDDVPFEAPPGLLARIHSHNFDVERRLVSKAQNKRVRHKQFDEGKWWADWGFDHLIESMDAAEEGNRNSYLHWAAATMAEEGALDEEFAALKAHAIAAGLTPLEVKRTIRSARSQRG